MLAIIRKQRMSKRNYFDPKSYLTVVYGSLTTSTLGVQPSENYIVNCYMVEKWFGSQNVPVKP